MNSDPEPKPKPASLKIRFFTLSQKIYLALFALMLLPFFCLAPFVPRQHLFWIALPSVLCSVTAGGALLKRWEKKMQRSVAQLVHARVAKIRACLPDQFSLSLCEEKIHHLTLELENKTRHFEEHTHLLEANLDCFKAEGIQLRQELNKKMEEMAATFLEFEDLRKEYHRLEEEIAHLLEESQKKLKHKDSLINEYQKTMAEQRMIIEKKQRYIAKLEGKVRDLNHEIRSLLQLESYEDNESFKIQPPPSMESFLLSPSAQHKPYDLTFQLQKFIEKAENLTGVEHLGYVGGKSPRFLDLSLDPYAVDRRRLLDSFKEEGNGALFILEPSEKKFLFVNSAIKSLLGWGSDKFIKDFPQLVLQGGQDWNERLAHLNGVRSNPLHLSLLSKSGEAKPISCYVGKISKGPFSDHIMGLFTLS